METPQTTPIVETTIDSNGKLAVFVDGKQLKIKGAMLTQAEGKHEEGFAEVCVCMTTEIKRF